MEGLRSNLNLNEGSLPRVMPRIGDWGPAEVPPTKRKRRMRWWVLLALVAVLGALVGYGYWIWSTLTGT